MFRDEGKVFSYFCPDCKETTDENEKTFFGIRGHFTCTQCGHEFEAGFKREEIKSSDTPSHRCDSCEYFENLGVRGPTALGATAGINKRNMNYAMIL
ncbi:hypothetical protein TNCT_17221 [Trichonephila clavata]|uniref:Uncharacterized protein n=1 Tax=Trichonephila clavata TaxID=2740835 RepID=A0A8X6J349_TRICU|nr:hypothetical protein TNCT_17221 [Trichonephila clavata]